jgi:hypothetical protein
MTKSFHIPTNITVKVTANGVVNGTLGVNNTAQIIVGSSTVIDKTQKGTSEASFSCSSASASMSSSSNTVKCTCSYSLQAAKVVVKGLEIKY